MGLNQTSIIKRETTISNANEFDHDEEFEGSPK